LSAVAPSRLLFQKPARSIAGISIVVVIAGFISPPSYIRQYSIAKKAGSQELRTLKSAGQYDGEKKKPGNAPGFFDEYFFRSVISRALRFYERAARPFGSHCSCG
jgi:hypothetical protein